MLLTDIHFYIPNCEQPENVLLSASRQVKIADFGLAKANRTTVTRGVGTPAFMVSNSQPPE